MPAAFIIGLSSAAQAGESIGYRYDVLGRLVRVDRGGTANGTITAQYGYDPADNRTRVIVSATGPSPTPPSPQKATGK